MNARKMNRSPRNTMIVLLGLGLGLSVYLLSRNSTDKKRQSIRQNEDVQKVRVAVGAPQILIAVGIVILLTAGVIAGYGFIDDYLAGQRAQAVLEQITPTGSAETTGIDLATGYTESVDDDLPPRQTDIQVEQASLELPEESTPIESTTEESIPMELRYDAIGVLSIPKLKLELPILSEYSDSLLKVSICRYEGEAVDKPERLVVAGHNYKTHFGKLRNLAVGDKVFFSNIEGQLYNYIVIEVTDISMYDHEELEQGDWDITLFTCDSDRSRRILIRCRED